MSSIGSLSVDLLLESSSFMNGMKRAAEQSAETSKAIKEQLDEAKEAVIGFAEVLAVDWFSEQINKALEYCESIKKVSEATGSSTTFIQQFAYAASQGGVSTDTANEALVRFTKSLGGAANGNQQVLKVFKDLGVTSTDTKAAILQFADGLEKVPTTAQKVADITAVFGRSAANLLPVLEEMAGEGFGELTAQAKNLGIVLDENVITGAVEAEHKLTALKMVISAEWANTIAQNADAISNLATAFMQAAGAAAHFFTEMNISKLMSLQQNNPLQWDLPTYIAGRLHGKSNEQVQDDARAQLMTTHEGRGALFKQKSDQYNAEIAKGTDKSLPFMQALLAERDDIKHADVLASAPSKAEGGQGFTLPPLKTHDKKVRTPRDRSPEQQSLFDKSLGQEQLEGLNLQEQMAVNPEDRAALQRQSLAFEWGAMGASGQWQGGLKDREIDDNLNAGKYGDKNSALAKSRADELKKQNDLNAQLQYQLVDRKLATELEAEDLSARQSGLQDQIDLLDSQKGLARTAAERKSIQDRIIDLEYQQQTNQLQATIASKESTDAQKKEAQARLALIPQLQAGEHVANAKQNMGPLDSYLDDIPKTVGEINESLQNTAVDGLGKFVDGIDAAIQGTGTLGDAFRDLESSILSGIVKIVLEETIIKPLGGLISGAVKGLGGDLGGLFGMRANGGMTSPGDYLVGERGPEVVSIGNNANVINHAQLSRLDGGGGSNGLTVSIGSITSNDPAAVRQMVMEGIAASMPIQSKQASDTTLKRLNRQSL